VSKRGAVGRNVLRKEGHEKATVLARCIEDISFDDVLYVRPIRSTVPAGEIADIRHNFDRTGYTTVDHGEHLPELGRLTLWRGAQPILIKST
jgi:CO/xanthine dehydrogenase Mo-binding subunit